MIKTNKSLWIVLLGLFMLPMLLQAKELPPDLEPLEEIPPPKISGDADVGEPEVTIIKKKLKPLRNIVSMASYT